MVYQTAGAEEYLEAIYQLGELGERATTTKLADWLQVAPPSVSEMMRRLGEQGLVHYRPYRSIRLTETGCIRASRLLRRQRLWEVLLFEHLRVPWHLIFKEACALEHGTTSLTESHLEQFLGCPPFCPHGYPIPEISSSVLALTGAPLSALKPGQSAAVRRIPERGSNVLEFLESRGIMPGVVLTIVDKSPPKSLVTVQAESQVISLDAKLIQTIVMDMVQS